MIKKKIESFGGCYKNGFFAKFKLTVSGTRYLEWEQQGQTMTAWTPAEFFRRVEGCSPED